MREATEAERLRAELILVNIDRENLRKILVREIERNLRSLGHAPDSLGTWRRSEKSQMRQITKLDRLSKMC